MKRTALYGKPLDSVLETLETQKILLEWQIGNMHLSLPPHRIIAHLQKPYIDLVMEKQTNTLVDDLSLLSRYISSSHAFIPHFEITLEEELRFLHTALLLKKFEVETIHHINIQYSVTTDVSPTLQSLLFFPSFIVLPYIASVFRTMRQDTNASLEIDFTQNDDESLVCNIKTGNCFFYGLTDRHGIIREALLIEQRRKLLLGLLGRTFQTTIIGNQATTREEVQQCYSQGQTQSEIKIIIPKISRHLVAELKSIAEISQETVLA